MITCKLALCSQMALLDRQSNNVSMINIMDEINVPVPAVLSTLSAVFILKRDSTDPETPPADLSVGMVGQVGQAQRFPVNIDFQGKLSSYTVIQMAGVPIPLPGTLRAELFLPPTATSPLAAWDIKVDALYAPTVIKP
jgi:hypothetical protein